MPHVYSLNVKYSVIIAALACHCLQELLRSDIGNSCFPGDDLANVLPLIKDMFEAMDAAFWLTETDAEYQTNFYNICWSIKIKS